MRAFGKLLGRILMLLAAVGGLLWWFGPYEDVDLSPEFDHRRFGEGVQVYFESVESAYAKLVPGVEKRVIWQDGFKEQRTPYSVVYLHGFSASSEEIRPVPDRIAEALGANLVYARLEGHGLDGDALASATASGWMRDTAETLAAGRAVGEKLVVISTSTGGTLAAAAALHPELSRDVAALIFVSPNFGVNDPNAWVLTLPAARHWLPMVLGGERTFEAANEAQATYWTNAYSWSALAPMAALVKAVVALDFRQAGIPALFRISDSDTVVRPDLTHHIAGLWGADATVHVVEMGEGDDPSSHVIAGDIMSPGQTDIAVKDMLMWLAQIGVQ
ncbi:alpha/beta hydrolase [Primorskyibacter sp. S87]|uniref:alpha/beta hydrolase n=1 Tax=Primorskyibacter sp. S87 TaxID=3415126 RepID=UPI003C7AC135